jgi:hypothetical protein
MFKTPEGIRIIGINQEYLQYFLLLIIQFKIIQQFYIISACKVKYSGKKAGGEERAELKEG